MITVPFTINFDKNQIGKLHIDEKELPTRGDYIFSIGGEVLRKKGNEIKEFRLDEISLVSSSKGSDKAVLLSSILEDKLKEIGKEMIRQDNRATQFPLYMIQEDVEVDVNTNFTDPTHYRVMSYDGDNYLITVEEYLKMEEEDTLDTDETEYSPVKFVKEFVSRTGPFLTEKAAQEHIDANNYHYNNPTIFVISAWRNSELQEVMKYLCSLAGETPSHYN